MKRHTESVLSQFFKCAYIFKISVRNITEIDIFPSTLLPLELSLHLHCTVQCSNLVMSVTAAIDNIQYILVWFQITIEWKINDDIIIVNCNNFSMIVWRHDLTTYVLLRVCTIVRTIVVMKLHIGNIRHKRNYLSVVCCSFIPKLGQQQIRLIFDW